MEIGKIMKIRKTKVKLYNLKNCSGSRTYDYLNKIRVRVLSEIDERCYVYVKVVSNERFRRHFQFEEGVSKKLTRVYKENSLKGTVFRFNAIVIPEYLKDLAKLEEVELVSYLRGSK